MEGAKVLILLGSVGRREVWETVSFLIHRRKKEKELAKKFSTIAWLV